MKMFLSRFLSEVKELLEFDLAPVWPTLHMNMFKGIMMVIFTATVLPLGFIILASSTGASWTYSFFQALAMVPIWLAIRVIGGTIHTLYHTDSETKVSQLKNSKLTSTSVNQVSMDGASMGNKQNQNGGENN